MHLPVLVRKYSARIYNNQVKPMRIFRLTLQFMQSIGWYKILRSDITHLQFIVMPQLFIKYSLQIITETDLLHHRMRLM